MVHRSTISLFSMTFIISALLLKFFVGAGGGGETADLTQYLLDTAEFTEMFVKPLSVRERALAVRACIAFYIIVGIQVVL